jgi:hypothetical protein
LILFFSHFFNNVLNRVQSYEKKATKTNEITFYSLSFPYFK